MRLLKRYLQTIWYCQYQGQEVVTDENGYETGEMQVIYDRHVSLRCSVSSAKGYAQTEIFGSLDNYDKVIITDNTSCPIDENTVLFIDKTPEYAQDGTPLYDYVVKRVSKSKNFISFAVAKVKTS